MKKEKITEDNWYEEFVNYVIKNWKEKRGKLEDETKARDYIGAMMFLMGAYRERCLITTILDLYDLEEKFNEENDIH